MNITIASNIIVTDAIAMLVEYEGLKTNVAKRTAAIAANATVSNRKGLLCGMFMHMQKLLSSRYKKLRLLINYGDKIINIRHTASS